MIVLKRELSFWSYSHFVISFERGSLFSNCSWTATAQNEPWTQSRHRWLGHAKMWQRQPTKQSKWRLIQATPFLHLLRVGVRLPRLGLGCHSHHSFRFSYFEWMYKPSCLRPTAGNSHWDARYKKRRRCAFGCIGSDWPENSEGNSARGTWNRKGSDFSLIFAIVKQE